MRSNSSNADAVVTYTSDSLRHRLAPTFFLVMVSLTLVQTFIVGYAAADGNVATCHRAFIVSFVLNLAFTLFLLATWPQHIVPWRGTCALVLESTAVVGGVLFLCAMAQVPPVSPLTAQLNRLVGAAQVLLTVPASVIGNAMCAVNIIRLVLVRFSNVRVATRAQIRRFILLTELDKIEALVLRPQRSKVERQQETGGEQRDGKNQRQKRKGGGGGVAATSGGGGSWWSF